MANKTKEVLQEILLERYRQDGKWGEQNHPNGTGNPEFTERMNAAKAACDKAVAEGNLTWAAILMEEFFEALAEQDPLKLRGELVQVSAVAAGWIESIDRAELKRKGAVRQLPDAPGVG